MVIVGTFLPTYAQWSGMDASAHLRQRWYARLLGAIRLSLIMVWGVLRHPASAHPQGWMLVFALVWLGVVYGTLDGLFFTVMPVLAIQQMWEARGEGDDGAARYMRMGASMGASLVVTAAYHWGFVECCSTPIGLPPHWQCHNHVWLPRDWQCHHPRWGPTSLCTWQQYFMVWRPRCNGSRTPPKL